MVRVAAGDRMVLELAEVAREGDVLGARDVLVAEEQHPVLEQRARISANRPSSCEASPRFDAEQLGADRAGQLVRLAWHVLSSDDEDRRAGGLARFEIAVRLRGVLELVALVDLDLDAAAATWPKSSPASSFFSAGSAM